MLILFFGIFQFLNGVKDTAYIVSDSLLHFFIYLSNNTESRIIINTKIQLRSILVYKI